MCQVFPCFGPGTPGPKHVFAVWCIALGVPTQVAPAFRGQSKLLPPCAARGQKVVLGHQPEWASGRYNLLPPCCARGQNGGASQPPQKCPAPGPRGGDGGPRGTPPRALARLCPDSLEKTCPRFAGAEQLVFRFDQQKSVWCNQESRLGTCHPFDFCFASHQRNGVRSENLMYHFVFFA
jgi:hypothetical protein